MREEKTFNHKDRKEHKGKTYFSLWPLWLILLFAACIPATPPANVRATPGEAVTITQNTYANTIFRVEYPTGWRVITSPAGATPSATFVAPGNCMLIVVASESTTQSLTSPSCDQPDIQTTTQAVTLGDKTITIAGSAPSADWDAFTQAMDRVAASLKAAL